MSVKTVAIVDGYGAALNFPSVFASKGFSCIQVLSTPEILEVFKKTYNKDLYTETLTFNGNVEALVSELKRRDVKCVFAGTEPGVELADILSEKLGLNTNGTALSKARRDKFVMGNVIAEAKLPTPKFAKVSTWDTICEWKDKENVSYPIVIKRLNSAGTDGVSICKDETSLKEAFFQLIKRSNLLGSLNQEVLVQSFLDGQEYVINSVSMNGKTYPVAILKSKKRLVEGHGYIYDREEMLERKGAVQKQLVKMHKAILKALNIQHGPAHGEYMLTKDGVILIECASRVSGGVHPKGNTLSVGCSQIELTVDAYVDPSSFLDKTNKPYEKKREFYQILLSTSKPGIIEGASPFLEKARSLQSFCDGRLRVTDGQSVKKTIDFPSALGSIFLVHESKEIIEKEYQELIEGAESLVKAQPA